MRESTALSNLIIGLATAVVLLTVAYVFFDLRQISVWSLMIVSGGAMLGLMAAAVLKRK
jgi:flagellar motor component MotA